MPFATTRPRPLTIIAQHSIHIPGSNKGWGIEQHGVQRLVRGERERSGAVKCRFLTH